MSRLSLLKSSSSSASSVSSGSRRSTMNESPSPVSYVQIPGLSPQRPSSTGSGQSVKGQTEYAEMLDDDNMAWGKPSKKKSSRR